MAEETSGFPPPILFAGAVLDPYRHICAFVDSRAKEYRLLDSFVIDGLEHGDKLSIIVDPADRSTQVRHYRHLGLDMATLMSDGQIELRAWAETHPRTGRFDMDAMLTFAEEMMSVSPSPRPS